MKVLEVSLTDLLARPAQYLIPCWQRRYRWNRKHIERLVDDIQAVAKHNSDQITHFTGSLIVRREPYENSTIDQFCVVDGQQRLTTVSILLGCIANVLGPKATSSKWTKQKIIEEFLLNVEQPEKRQRKLRLQENDEEEYKNCINGLLVGPGGITSAWANIAGMVKDQNTELLLEGTMRLRVACIELAVNEDPQAIFESLNTTGKRLTESEKIKNWLFASLSDEMQRELYEQSWIKIEQILDATESPGNIEEFFRDVVAVNTGIRCSMNDVYQDFRKWANKSGMADDRSRLCLELRDLALLYGMVIRTVEPHKDFGIRQELRHLHEMKFKIHRPLALCVLREARAAGAHVSTSKWTQILQRLSACLTRMWLAEEDTDKLGESLAYLAHRTGNDKDAIQRLSDMIVEVGNRHAAGLGDKTVRKGIRKRRVYDSSNSIRTKSILCQLEEAEQMKELPDRDSLTVEHIMPQQLSAGWEHDLGDAARKTHDKFLHRLSNLTIISASDNSRTGNSAFAIKRKIYKANSIRITKRIAEYGNWNITALKRRADELAGMVFERWPWPVQPEVVLSKKGKPKGTMFGIQWKIGDGPWNEELACYKMVLNVAVAILARENCDSKKLFAMNIFARTQSGYLSSQSFVDENGLLVNVPGFSDLVICPYGICIEDSIGRCQKMAQGCGLGIEINSTWYRSHLAFRELLMENHGGLPGQENWNNEGSQYIQCDDHYDDMGITIGFKGKIGLWIRVGGSGTLGDRTERAAKYSKIIRKHMLSEKFTGGSGRHQNGLSTRVVERWTENEHEWPRIASWVMDKHARLRSIIESMD